jgi:hypothetical protein
MISEDSISFRLLRGGFTMRISSKKIVAATVKPTLTLTETSLVFSIISNSAFTPTIAQHEHATTVNRIAQALLFFIKLSTVSDLQKSLR